MQRSPLLRFATVALTFIAAALCGLQNANAQNGLSGKEVVEQVCAECHETGVNGAPKIGDVAAWSARASAGLSALTQHALDGIRQMPAHGGQAQLSDLEIARAVTYMVNESGGDWVAPTTRSQIMKERTGEQVVKAVCSECHQEGKGGAPQIGDKKAWAPRLRQGLSYAVRSAIHGHGGMPPRGGAASLTDTEIRDAILYMFNPQAATATASALAPVETRTAPKGSYHVTVGGMDIYLGLVSADMLRSYPPESAERTMHGGIPDGNNWYHVNVSLLDKSTHAPIDNAQVDATVDELGMGGETKPLEALPIGEGSYGDYFRIKPGTPYRIIVSVRAPGSLASVRAEFTYEHE